jgi:hypothetical protein
VGGKANSVVTNGSGADGDSTKEGVAEALVVAGGGDGETASAAELGEGANTRRRIAGDGAAGRPASAAAAARHATWCSAPGEEPRRPREKKVRWATASATTKHRSKKWRSRVIYM